MLVTTALDEEALPADLRRAVLASFPQDRRAFLAACGTVGLDRRPSTVTLAFGADERAARRRDAGGSRAQPRPAGAALPRAQSVARGTAVPVAGRGDLDARARRGARASSAPSVDAACAIFEEVGLAAREGTAAGWQVRLVPADGRRDLRASLRFREGVREREAFEAFAAWVGARDARRDSAGGVVVTPHRGG